MDRSGEKKMIYIHSLGRASRYFSERVALAQMELA